MGETSYGTREKMYEFLDKIRRDFLVFSYLVLSKPCELSLCIISIPLLYLSHALQKSAFFLSDDEIKQHAKIAGF